MPNMRKLERDRKQAELDKKIEGCKSKLQILQQKRDDAEAQLDLLRKQLAVDSKNTDLHDRFMECMREYQKLCYQINAIEVRISNGGDTVEDIFKYIVEDQTATYELYEQKHTAVFAPTSKFPVDPHN